jgi:hypothetical protein
MKGLISAAAVALSALGLAAPASAQDKTVSLKIAH